MYIHTHGHSILCKCFPGPNYEIWSKLNLRLFLWNIFWFLLNLNGKNDCWITLTRYKKTKWPLKILGFVLKKSLTYAYTSRLKCQHSVVRNAYQFYVIVENMHITLLNLNIRSEPTVHMTWSKYCTICLNLFNLSPSQFVKRYIIMSLIQLSSIRAFVMMLSASWHYPRSPKINVRWCTESQA